MLFPSGPSMDRQGRTAKNSASQRWIGEVQGWLIVLSGDSVGFLFRVVN